MPSKHTDDEIKEIVNKGIQHEMYVKGLHKNKEKFKQQQEHDKRKKEYALNNGYNFLEIWYYDIDNVETILDKYIDKLNHNI